MNEIITTVLAIAIAAQVAAMAKVGKNYVNASLKKTLTGQTETGNSQAVRQIDVRTETGVEAKYEYDGNKYGYKDHNSGNRNKSLKSDISLESSLKLSL